MQTTLRLTGFGLAAVPAELCSLTQLEELFLDKNALVSLPDALCAATRLEVLSVRDNLLERLPAGMGALARLRVLDAENNRLTCLPDLAATTELKIGGNLLSALPASLGALPLEKLFVADNDLRGLDGLLWPPSLRALDLENGPEKPGRRRGSNAVPRLPELDKLVHLGILYVNGVGLSELPSLARLAALRVLCAGDNDLEALPDDLPPNLETLHCERNRLAALPAALGGLAALERLVASGNRLETLPDDVGCLTNLRVVHLDGNALAALPESAGRWSRVEEMLIFDNAPLAGLPAACDWPRLRTLYARHTRLAALPPVSSWANAVTLELSGAKLATLPDMGPLASVTELLLHDNCLVALPPLDGLSALAILLVDGNRLGALPPLPDTLRVLDATRNRLARVDGPLPRDLRMLGLGGNYLQTCPPLGARVHTCLLGDNMLAEAPSFGPSLKILGLYRNPLASPPPAARGLRVDVDGADLLRDNLERAAPAALDVCCSHGFRVDGSRLSDTVTSYRGTAAVRATESAPAPLPTTRRVVVNGSDSTWPTDYDAATVDDAYANGREVLAQNLDRAALSEERQARTRWIPIGLDFRATFDIYHRRQRHVLLAAAELDAARDVPRAPDRIPRCLVTWRRESTTSERFVRHGYASREDLFDQAVASGADVVLGDRGDVWRAMASHEFVRALCPFFSVCPHRAAVGPVPRRRGVRLLPHLGGALLRRDRRRPAVPA